MLKVFTCSKFCSSGNVTSPLDDVGDNCQFSMVPVLVFVFNDSNMSDVRVRCLLPSWPMVTLL